MKRFKHWTPRYILKRLILWFTEMVHPDWPWLTSDAVRILDQVLSKKDIGYEFGSGRSTLWFAERIEHLTSVENDKSWYDLIKDKIEKQDINNVDYLLKDDREYAETIDGVSNESIDFVLVDGARRDECAVRSLPKIKRGGLLVVDNINWFLPSHTKSPASKKEEEFGSDIWKNFYEKVKNKRKIWTSNGVTDTLIVFI